MQEIDELTGRVAGFRILEDFQSPIQPLESSLTASIGDPQVYAFVPTATSMHAGSLRVLRPRLASFAEANPNRHGIVVQIRELIGTGQEKKVARARMRTLLLEQQGAAAARSYYEGSVLKSILWSCLLASAIDAPMCRRILHARGQLSASVNADGTISIDLSSLSADDQKHIDIEKLISEIMLEFELPPDANDRSYVIEHEDIELVKRRAKELARSIALTGRQEERIAMLIAAILNDPAVGKSALSEYKSDRAQTAAWTLAELRKLFVGARWDSDEQVIAALLPRLFKQQWPMTRGDLLLSLANHLAKWPRINQAIHRIVGSTRSAYVEMWRSEINHALDGTSTKVAIEHEAIQSELFKK
ncbi:hypothetical protein [Bradyrhizobium sp. F1.13.3]|uniref:hypothetical protein n=1 Tax=Bradyrhizobium sp. F1.13.3 TaxID=3156351 RepID=UPI00339B3731